MLVVCVGILGLTVSEAPWFCFAPGSERENEEEEEKSFSSSAASEYFFLSFLSKLAANLQISRSVLVGQLVGYTSL